MSFSCSNTLASFQRYINKIFTKKLDIIYHCLFGYHFGLYQGPQLATRRCNALRFRTSPKIRALGQFKKVLLLPRKGLVLGIGGLGPRHQHKGKKYKIVKAWLKRKLIKDIQVFLGLSNFYQRFIKNFSKILVLLTLILKTTSSPTNINT